MSPSHSHARVQHVPKSLLVSEAVELCKRTGQSMLFVVDVDDKSFTPSSPSLPPSPIIGLFDPGDYFFRHTVGAKSRRSTVGVPRRSTAAFDQRRSTASVAFADDESVRRRPTSVAFADEPLGQRHPTASVLFTDQLPSGRHSTASVTFADEVPGQRRPSQATSIELSTEMSLRESAREIGQSSKV